MTNPDYRALCAELLDELELWSSWHDATDLKDRAGAALDLAEPVAEGPTDEELDELFTEIDQSGEALSWRLYARAALARWGRPTPQPVPEPGEVSELVEELEMMASHAATTCQFGDAKILDDAATLLSQLSAPMPQPAPEPGKVAELVAELVADLNEIAEILCGMEKHRWAVKLTRAAILLQQQAAPSPVPVPVSERLPKPEDCDVQGRCWLGGHQLGNGTPTWLLGYPAWAERFPDVHHFWLPANALPLPAPEGGEVS